MAVTVEQRVAALERSVREIATAVAELARNRRMTERMTIITGRHIEETGDPGAPYPGGS
jgi:hypothetical protein